MSELQTTLAGGSGTGPTMIGAASEACAPATILARPAVKTSAAESFSLLKRIVSFPAMLGTLLVGAVFVIGRGFFVDPDLWWHIKTGQNILATHHWPTTDPYSFTVAGNPWMAYEWLGEVLLGGVARLGGLRGLDALLIVLGSAILIALYAYATLRSGNSKAGFVTAAALYVLVTASLSLRPQMLGYLFIILTLIALERFRQNKPRALWFLPILFLVWINTHGSFIVGLGIIFVYWAAGLKAFRLGGIEARRWTPAERLRLAFVFLLCLAVLPVTPYGTRLAVYPFDMAFSQPVNVASILEWQPMPFNILGGKIFLVFLLAYFGLQVAFAFAWRFEELMLFLGGTALACLHLRFLLLFVPFFAPILAMILVRWLPRYERDKDKYFLNALLMVGMIAAMVHYFPSKSDLQERVANQFPVRAVEYLRQHSVPGPMFNTYGFGGYLVWSGRKVFIDGRGDLYEHGGVLSDYMHITLAKPGALAVLEGYHVGSCLLQRDEPLSTILSASPNWKKIYSDNISALFVRTAAVAPLSILAASPNHAASD
jgi:hypothetical protein